MCAHFRYFCLLCLNHVYQHVSCVWVSLRRYPVLQIYVRHEQHRVGLQVHRYRRPQRAVPDRYFILEQIHAPFTFVQTCFIWWRATLLQTTW